MDGHTLAMPSDISADARVAKPWRRMLPLCDTAPVRSGHGSGVGGRPEAGRVMPAGRRINVGGRSYRGNVISPDVMTRVPSGGEGTPSVRGARLNGYALNGAGLAGAELGGVAEV